MVGTVSSAARIPLPRATSARAVCSRSVFMGPSLFLGLDRGIPALHRGRASVVTENAYRGCVEQKVSSSGRRKSDPTRREHPEDVAVGKQGDTTRDRLEPADQSIDSRSNLLWALATRTSVREEHPVRGDALYLVGSEALILAVI